MRQNVTHNPQQSGRRSQELQISKTSLWRILGEYLKCYPYEIQLVLKIGRNDCEKMFQFARSFIEIFQQEEKMCSLLMTDETHFYLNSFVNKQNFKYWGL